MSIINAIALSAAGDDGYRIERSLRFNNPTDTVSLTRTPASAGNRRTWTWSAWIKRAGEMNGSSSGDYYQMLFAGNTPGTNDATYTSISFYNNSFAIGGYSTNWRISNALFRDASAWYHFVVTVDTTDATANNRVRAYVNGTELTWATTNNPTQNTDWGINQAVNHSLCGAVSGGGQGLAGYLTEVNFIDGQALTPSSFGETNAITGVWQPKKYAGTYGTNGFYLKFADNSNTTAATLGKDSSGNGNNWTPNNFSVTAGVGNDSFIDTPTPYADGGNGRGNYCTLNPLDIGSTNIAVSNGNLDFTKSSANFSPSRGTIGVATGKWYFEMLANNGTSPIKQVGVSNDYDIRAISGDNSVSYTGGIGAAWDSRGYLYQTGASPSYAYSYTTNDIVMVAFDAGSGKIWFGKNGTWNTGDPAAGTSPAFTASGYSVLSPFVNGESGGSGSCNFGQRPFAYTPPSGFLALNTQNLSEPSIKKPSSYMDATLYTGTGAAQSISGLGFSPDLVWIKKRSAAASSNLIDSVRGVRIHLESDTTNTEYTEAAGVGLTSFNSDGFSLGTDNAGPGQVNANTGTYVAWCWDKSATPGFDIVTYTGNGGTQNIGHNLGVAPKFILIKSRNNADNWYAYHASIGNTGALNPNLTGATITNSGYWNNTTPTSSVFTVGTIPSQNTWTYVAYLWSEVAGFSKFGSYTGNASSDGPFVYCGFRPRFVIIKKSSASGTNWVIDDTARGSINYSSTIDPLLYPNLNIAESNGNIDILSNGFKIRYTDGDYNASGATYIFAAFAESPQKYSLAR